MRFVSYNREQAITNNKPIMNQIEKFYSAFMQEVGSRQLANEDGETQEQAFTRYVLDLLSEAGETENAAVAFDEKALGTAKQHKINGFAISDNYETIDLFISIYELEEEIYTVPKAEITRAATRLSNFFRKATYDDYSNEVAESSEIFEFAHTLANYQELKDNLVRVNIHILTNGEYKGDIPDAIEINGYKVFFRVVDIRYIYQISEESRVPIEINFKEEGYTVPCLPAPTDNTDYQAYIAIIPGECLASLYEHYGARLLEQNVRSFLQFTGKINKGIRDTIKNEPHMFLAFNNGLAATADHIVLDENNRYIEQISNLQIVNGGQTTASIYHTYKKDKADISGIYVQAKISVIKRIEEYSDIVSRISRYANTQNKVNDADFTANNPFLVALEKLSRFMLTPRSENAPNQTYWFFERARGQFKNLRQKEGFTKVRQKAFDLKYPKNQMFTKVELAKYINAYSEVYEGKKLVIGPHIVVRGNEKNFAKFINNNLPSSIGKINNIYYEDTIAKTILFRTMDKLYGTKKSASNIGELKQVVVPYTISLLSVLTGNRLNLYKIWKEQSISEELSAFLYDLMKQVNEFILNESPVSHYIEWSKKEDCWNKIKEHTWRYNLLEIADDLIDTNSPIIRKEISFGDTVSDSSEHDLGIILSIPYQLWTKIAEWGKDSDFLSINYQTSARDIGHKIRFNHKLTENDIHRGMAIYNIVCEKNIELLLEADELSTPEEKPKQELSKEQSNVLEMMTIELVKKMVDWDRRRRILKDWQWNAMNSVASGKKQLDDRMKFAFYNNYKRLKERGFNEND
jgi:hypothetical protein